jgi:D-arabinose 1-dehydrogenase-like Zn-dependent alcohol dehydrogenase
VRALRFHGPGDLRLETVPDAAPGAGEALVAVEACGVCGSDLHFLDGSARTAHVPITIGHEVAGVVRQSSDPAFPTGAPVLVSAGGHCGECRRCAEGRPNLCERAAVLGITFDGGLADLLAVRTDMLIPRPPGLPADVAATAVDAGSTAWHAVTRRGGVGAGDIVAIIGIGGLGGYAVQIARGQGAGAVIAVDTDRAALEWARELGADEVVEVGPDTSIGRAVKLLTDGGADVALEFVGRAATVDAAVKSIRPGGTAVAVGVGLEPVATVPPVLWSNNEYTLVGSYGSLPGDTEEVLARLSSGDLKPPAITHASLDDAAAQIQEMASGGRRVVGRLVVQP